MNPKLSKGIGFLLSAALLLAVLLPAAGGTGFAFGRNAGTPLPDGEYRTWKQKDSRWCDVVIGIDPWKDANGVRHTYETVGHAGCLITSMAILAKAHGLSLADGTPITPGTLAEALYDGGSMQYLTKGGAIKSHDGFGELIPGVSYVGRVYSPSASTIKEYLNDPDHTYFLIAGVKSGGHYVAIDYAEGKTVYICDPGFDETLLFSYSCSFMHVYEVDENMIGPSDLPLPGDVWEVVSDSALRIRTGPGLDFDVKGYYQPGALISVTDQTEADGYLWGKTVEGWTALRSLNGSDVFCVLKEERRHTVTLYANDGGDGVFLSFEKTEGASASLPADIPEREGYRFLGWAADPDAISAEYAAGGTLSDDGVTDLYAVWMSLDGIFGFGVDVSSHQKEIDWETAAASGVSFAIIRAGTSKGEDDYFQQNYENAKAAGVLVGSYFYSYAVTEAELREDLEKFAELLSGKEWDYPVYLDLESSAQKALGQDVLTGFASLAVSYLDEKGYYAGVYSSESWFRSLIRTEDVGGIDRVWMAKWMESRTLTQNLSGSCALYQYSDQGYIDGIPKRVDLDVSYRDFHSLIRSLGKNGFSADPEPPPVTIPSSVQLKTLNGTDYYVGGRSGETVSEWLDALDLPGASLFEKDGTEANPNGLYRTGLELRLDGSRVGVTVLWGDMNGDG
ncbi:MAG: InlB B-repeat-containing protein, partial [Clostridia bacterium]|nr:InlB B-repeat-containing protein [Clostridia bacterium]